MSGRRLSSLQKWKANYSRRSLVEKREHLEKYLLLAVWGKSQTIKTVKKSEVSSHEGFHDPLLHRVWSKKRVNDI
jgi:hypothetical protein